MIIVFVLKSVLQIYFLRNLGTVHSLPLCTCHQVSKPNIGETRPSRVRADVTINLNMRDIVKAEWEGRIVVAFFGQKLVLTIEICGILYFSLKETRCGIFGDCTSNPVWASEVWSHKAIQRAGK